MKLKARFSGKTQLLPTLPDDVTVEDLIAALEGSLGCKGPFRVSAGFPPIQIDVSSKSRSLASLGVRSGTVIDVSVDDTRPASTPAPVPTEEFWACPVCTLVNEAARAHCAACDAARPGAPATVEAQPRAAAATPSSLVGGLPPLSEAKKASPRGLWKEATLRVTRRIVDADNSCLFNALGHLLFDRIDGLAPAMRRLVAETVLADPGTFSAAVLGKSPGEYAAWITRTSSWGGDVELSVLSKHFATEVVAFDVRTGVQHRFGQGRGFGRMVAVVFDGIHYDGLVAAGDGELAGEEVTVFAPDDSEFLADGAAQVAELRAARQFTDVESFALMCMVCNERLRGQREALEHARRTGHGNFGEISGGK